MIYPDSAEQTDIFKLHHKKDPASSKKAAKGVKMFKLGHEGKIRELLMRWPGATSKELEKHSQDTPYSLTHIQIDRRIGAMKGVRRDTTVLRDSCHPIYLC